jgi:hypothetical protein
VNKIKKLYRDLRFVPLKMSDHVPFDPAVRALKSASGDFLLCFLHPVLTENPETQIRCFTHQFDAYRLRNGDKPDIKWVSP